MMEREVEAGLTVPARKSVAAKPLWSGRRPPAQMQLLTQALDYLRPDPLHPNIVEIRSVIDRTMADLWSGAGTAQAITSEITQLVDPLLRKVG